MTTSQSIALFIYVLVLLVWVTRHRRVTRTRRGMAHLTPGSPAHAPDQAPLVSVIIPAKDEEQEIGDCLMSVLNQNYLRLEVIVVNDRSSDNTANVVRAFAARDPRVRLVTARELPPGWTGKTNALATGVREASGEWLLFVDCDTRHAPENLSVVVEYARRQRADMVSVLPRWRSGTFWERVVQPLAGTLLMLNFPMERVNDDSDVETAFANGQYILIRRQVHDAIGGHAAVRNQFVEDIHLARIVKAHGYRIRVASAPQLSSTRMYTSLSELVRGWSRILYAGYDHSTAHLTAVLAGLTLFSLSAYAVAGVALARWLLGHWSPFAWWLSALCVAHLVLQASVMVRTYSITASDRRYVALYGLASAVMFVVLASAVRKCFTHRIVWRGTRYENLHDAVPLPAPPAPRLSPAERPWRRAA